MFEFSKCSSDEMSSLLFSRRSSSLSIGSLDKLLILFHSSSSNMFFKIAKRLFKDRGEKVKFVCGP